jgi:hypothetical protein
MHGIEFVKVGTIHAFPVMTCLLIIVDDVDDAGKVIAPDWRQQLAVNDLCI